MSKTLNIYSNFYCIFAIYIKFSAFWKKKISLNSLNISGVIDSEKYGYLNAWKLPF